MDSLLHNFDYLILKIAPVSGSPEAALAFIATPFTGDYPAGSVAMAIKPSLSYRKFRT